MEKKEICDKTLTGERALFASRDLILRDCTFDDGESPLKESCNIEIYNSKFQWKYPLWYCNNVYVRDCSWAEMGRAGVWYTNKLTVENCHLYAPKNFRRCRDINLLDVDFSLASETLWNCCDLKLKNIQAQSGDYFLMGSKKMDIQNMKLAGDYAFMEISDASIDGLELDGNYGFDGASNVTIRNSKLMTKDAFWNTENVTVYDSYIEGEYLGWNAKNLTLINCQISSLQGLCYIDNLVMKNCKLLDTTLCMEYCTLDAEIDGVIESVLNPISGRIVCDGIKELILEEDKIDPKKTEIIYRS